MTRPGSSSPFVSDVPAAAAVSAWLDACREAGCPDRLDPVRVPVGDALGRVTAEPVWATRSSPAADLAAMDGIAVRSVETHGASPTTPKLLAPGQYVVVDTGDPAPDGFDAVVMREHVHYEGEAAEIMAAVPPYQHVRSIGEDVSAGELLLPEGHRMRPVDIASAAAAGAIDVVVRRRPRVAVIPTGDEIVAVGSEPEHGEILDTNSMMLVAQAKEAGCEAWATEIEPDDVERIGAAVRAAAAEADLVVVVAGSSAGRDDYTAGVVADLGVLAVHGVAVRPGHPVVLGVVGKTPVIGCPGYPVSAALTFDIFAAPLLAGLEGVAPSRRPSVRARLARKLPSVVGMDDWVRVRLGAVHGEVVASPL
ncbi:molybdopterin biosynthesis protein, partial [Nocardioides sp.]